MNTTLQQIIFNTADELLRNNTIPTNKSIREKLGKYSYSQITPLLKEWKQLRLGYSTNQIPLELEKELSVLGNKIWNQAIKKTREDYEKIHQMDQKLIDKHKIEIQNLERKNALLEDEYFDDSYENHIERIKELELQLQQKTEHLELTLFIDYCKKHFPNSIPLLLKKHNIEQEKFDDFMSDLNKLLNTEINEKNN